MVTRLNYGQRVLVEQMFSLGHFLGVLKQPLDARIWNTMVLTCAIECIKTRGRTQNANNIIQGGERPRRPVPGQTRSSQIAANAGAIHGNKRDASV